MLTAKRIADGAQFDHVQQDSGGAWGRSFKHCRKLNPTTTLCLRASRVSTTMKDQQMSWHGEGPSRISGDVKHGEVQRFRTNEPLGRADRAPTCVERQLMALPDIVAVYVAAFPRCRPVWEISSPLPAHRNEGTLLGRHVQPPAGWQGPSDLPVLCVSHKSTLQALATIFSATTVFLFLHCGYPVWHRIWTTQDMGTHHTRTHENSWQHEGALQACDSSSGLRYNESLMPLPIRSAKLHRATKP